MYTHYWLCTTLEVERSKLGFGRSTTKVKLRQLKVEREFYRMVNR